MEKIRTKYICRKQIKKGRIIVIIKKLRSLIYFTLQIPIYLISIPLGVKKAIKDGSRFDTITSAFIIVAYAIPGFLFAILLLVVFAGGSYFQWFPLRGLTSEGFENMSLLGKSLDYVWHITL